MDPAFLSVSVSSPRTGISTVGDRQQWFQNIQRWYRETAACVNQVARADEGRAHGRSFLQAIGGHDYIWEALGALEGDEADWFCLGRALHYAVDDDQLVAIKVAFVTALKSVAHLPSAQKLTVLKSYVYTMATLLPFQMYVEALKEVLQDLPNDLPLDQLLLAWLNQRDLPQEFQAWQVLSEVTPLFRDACFLMIQPREDQAGTSNPCPTALLLATSDDQWTRLILPHCKQLGSLPMQAEFVGAPKFIERFQQLVEMLASKHQLCYSDAALFTKDIHTHAPEKAIQLWRLACAHCGVGQSLNDWLFTSPALHALNYCDWQLIELASAIGSQGIVRSIHSAPDGVLGTYLQYASGLLLGASAMHADQDPQLIIDAVKIRFSRALTSCYYASIRFCWTHAADEQAVCRLLRALLFNICPDAVGALMGPLTEAKKEIAPFSCDNVAAIRRAQWVPRLMAQHTTQSQFNVIKEFLKVYEQDDAIHWAPGIAACGASVRAEAAFEWLLERSTVVARSPDEESPPVDALPEVDALSSFFCSDLMSLDSQVAEQFMERIASETIPEPSFVAGLVLNRNGGPVRSLFRHLSIDGFIYLQSIVYGLWRGSSLFSDQDIYDRCPVQRMGSLTDCFCDILMDASEEKLDLFVESLTGRLQESLSLPDQSDTREQLEFDFTTEVRGISGMLCQAAGLPDKIPDPLLVSKLHKLWVVDPNRIKHGLPNAYQVASVLAIWHRQEERFAVFANEFLSAYLGHDWREQMAPNSLIEQRLELLGLAAADEQFRRDRFAELLALPKEELHVVIPFLTAELSNDQLLEITKQQGIGFWSMKRIAYLSRDQRAFLDADAIQQLTDAIDERSLHFVGAYFSSRCAYVKNFGATPSGLVVEGVTRIAEIREVRRRAHTQIQVASSFVFEDDLPESLVGKPVTDMSRLKGKMSSLNLAALQTVLAEYQLTESVLGDWDVTSMRAYFILFQEVTPPTLDGQAFVNDVAAQVKAFIESKGLADGPALLDYLASYK